MKKVFIIAEAGVNHNGSITTAKKMIDVAAKAGVDAVKFQTLIAEEFVCRFAPKAEYQKKNTTHSESQFEMIKKLKLSTKAHRELISHCKKKGVLFLSSPFGPKSIDLLNKLKLEIFKIPSGEITNLPYLRKLAKLKKKIILSTGMANLKEVKTALNVLARNGTTKKNITVLHCNTDYPTAFEDVNLTAIVTMKEQLKIKVGYSDHTPGIEVPIAAVALGATVIEKHFTLNKNMEGPDHKASIEPQELKMMVAAIRNIEKSLGSGTKKPSLSELKNKTIARKSLVAAKTIKKGEIFTAQNIAAKRPATGISPMKWDKVIGKAAIKKFVKDELITLS